jgi:hypothetical protein
VIPHFKVNAVVQQMQHASFAWHTDSTCQANEQTVGVANAFLRLFQGKLWIVTLQAPLQ